MPTATATLPTSASPAWQQSLPPAVARAVWRGDDLSHRIERTSSSGWDALDAELPGAGWPIGSITEVLTAQPAVLEWRLLAPALHPIAKAGGEIVVVSPPQHPHVPGLLQVGLNERRFIWIRAEAPAERMWVTEQLIKSNSAGAVIAWLPKARPEQLRRLQVCALSSQSLVFICRPELARRESSAAPLRVHASVGLDWELHVHLFKRRGPSHERPLTLSSVPGGLASVLTTRVREPSRLMFPEFGHAVDSIAVAPRPRRHATV